jgi:predicted N-formylglutamate amidohydrolase
MGGSERPWGFGVLHADDSPLSKAMLALLGAETPLPCGDNQPYFVSDDSDYAIPHYGERRGHLHVELELRQDLITYPDQQARWASLLARVLPAAVAAHAAR